MLRCCFLDVNPQRFLVPPKGIDQVVQVSIALDSSEPLLGFENGGPRPAEDHLAPSPALHPPCVGGDLVVEALDRVGAAQALAQPLRDAHLEQGERLLKALTDRRRRPGVLLGE